MDVADMLTKREAAEILEVTPHRVSQLVTEGRLTPAYRVGSFGATGLGQMLFDPADILAYAQARTDNQAGNKKEAS